MGYGNDKGVEGSLFTGAQGSRAVVFELPEVVRHSAFLLLQVLIKHFGARQLDHLHATPSTHPCQAISAVGRDGALAAIILWARQPVVWFNMVAPTCPAVRTSQSSASTGFPDNVDRLEVSGVPQGLRNSP